VCRNPGAVRSAKRVGILALHMEAGNRCYDDRVPEKVNRRVIDHCSSMLMPYPQRSKENRLREGVPGERIFVTGNPIFEVLTHYAAKIEESDVHRRLGLKPGEYFLVTMHRAGTVDVESWLRHLVESLRSISALYGRRSSAVCTLAPAIAWSTSACRSRTAA
jgi:UDP-N-acetylglucosamine 2-epimerase (non-hydrolysing)